MIERLNCESGRVCQVVRMCDKPRGECESKTLGFTCKVTNAVLIETLVVWAYEGPTKRCFECGHPFHLLPDRNMIMLPDDVKETNISDPVSRRMTFTSKEVPKRSIPNAR